MAWRRLPSDDVSSLWWIPLGMALIVIALLQLGARRLLEHLDRLDRSTEALQRLRGAFAGVRSDADDCRRAVDELGPR